MFTFVSPWTSADLTLIILLTTQIFKVLSDGGFLTLGQHDSRDV